MYLHGCIKKKTKYTGIQIFSTHNDESDFLSRSMQGDEKGIYLCPCRELLLELNTISVQVFVSHNTRRLHGRGVCEGRGHLGSERRVQHTFTFICLEFIFAC